MKTPTPEQFTQYQAAFDYFNAGLFDGKLPFVMLNFSRHSRSYGFFVPETWARGEESIPEISLNPDHLGERDLRATLSTLVHEMAHHWQFAFGKPSRGGYHNREWAEKMKLLGLYPSSTAAEGGAETGQRMSHYITSHGPFDVTFAKMPKDILLPWSTKPRVTLAAAKKKSKTPYVCLSCATKVWAKPGLTNLRCGDCDDDFEEQE